MGFFQIRNTAHWYFARMEPTTKVVIQTNLLSSSLRVNFTIAFFSWPINRWCVSTISRYFAVGFPNMHNCYLFFKRVVAGELFRYWEAIPAGRLLFPDSIKFFIGSFPPKPSIICFSSTALNIFVLTGLQSNVRAELYIFRDQKMVAVSTFFPHNLLPQKYRSSKPNLKHSVAVGIFLHFPVFECKL